MTHTVCRRVVGTFLNWYLNGQLPPNYDDQRGTIAYRYMNNLLTRFYDNPTLLLPVNNTVTVADPMVRNLRPRRQRRRLRRGDGDKENRPPTMGGALIPEAFYSKRTELNQLIADYATHNFMGFQEWRSTVPSITNEFMLHSQAQIQAEIEKMQGLIDQLRQIQASNWQRYAVGGSVAPSTPTARAGRTREATIRAIVEPLVQSGRITVRDRRIAIASIMRQLHVGRVEAEDLFFSAVGQLLD